jgi:hypothetical protein
LDICEFKPEWALWRGIGMAKKKARKNANATVKHRRKEAENANNVIIQKGYKRVKYSREWNQFVKNVAHSIRMHVVYRSDGGKFARELVAHWKTRLKAIHSDIKTLNETSEGEVILLWVELYRRKDPSPGNQWVLAAWFEPANYSADFDKGESSNVPSADERFERFLNDAVIALPLIGGRQGRKIRRYIEYATRVGRAKTLKLWIYSPWAVQQYREASEKEREKMFAEGGGNLPLDGEISHGGGPWRKYPLKEALEAHLARGETWTRATMVEYLQDIDNELEKSLGQIFVGQSATGSESGMAKNAPLWWSFRNHLLDLTKKRKDSLYYIAGQTK